MWWYLTLGLLLGILPMILLLIRYRRAYLAMDEERQHFRQEKQLVVEFIHNMVEAIGRGVSRSELYQRTVHAALLSSGAISACAFEKTPDGTLRGMAVEGLFPPQRPLSEASRIKLTTRARFIEQILKSEEYQMGEGLIGKVGQTGEALYIPNALEDPRVFQHPDSALEVRSLIVVPILFQGQVLGVLAVANPINNMPFNDTDFSLLESLGEQAGLALHNCELLNLQIEKNKLDMDLSLASNIQSMLLPKTFPKIPGIDIDAVYIPAQMVGGDLYDVIELGDQRVGLAIADVSGKGIPAGMLMALCQNNLRHFAKQSDSPAEVLRRMNRMMTPDMREDMFITIIYAIIDPVRRQYTVARAGHELPLHFRKDKDGLWVGEAIRSDGMALGMVPPDVFDEVLEDKTVPFHPEEILLFFTDGVTEAVNPEDIEYSSARLADTVRTLRTYSAKDLNQGILNSVESFSGKGSQKDDITLVTTKFLSDLPNV
jgi:sigma-B regulation protein RsbU (phosphoserine phosphatase)